MSIESGYRMDSIEELRARGHNTTLFDINLGIAEVQAIVRKPDGQLFGESFSFVLSSSPRLQSRLHRSPLYSL